MDEVFGVERFKSQIALTKSTGLSSAHTIVNRLDYLLWYAKGDDCKYRPIFVSADPDESGYNLRDDDGRLYMSDNLTKPGPARNTSLDSPVVILSLETAGGVYPRIQ
jgi:hypothetical protein